MVLEGFVSKLLNQYLGDFIHISKDQLKIGLLKGAIEFRNLQVKEDCLDFLGFPISVKIGFIHLLKLNIPWKNLNTKRSVLEIDKMFIITIPKKIENYDPMQKRAKDYRKKLHKLKRWEDTDFENLSKKLNFKVENEEENKNKNKNENNLEDEDLEEESKKIGFKKRKGQQVNRNFSVKIKELIILYEDYIDNIPIRFGFKLDQLTMQAVNEKFERAFLTKDTKHLNKLVQVKNLSLFWDLYVKPFDDGLTIEKTLKMLNGEFQRRKNSLKERQRPKVRHQYLLKPISTVFKLKVNNDLYQNLIEQNIPKMVFSIILQKIDFSIEKIHYQLFQKIIENFNWYWKSTTYRKYLIPKYRPCYQSSSSRSNSKSSLKKLKNMNNNKNRKSKTTLNSKKIETEINPKLKQKQNQKTKKKSKTKSEKETETILNPKTTDTKIKTKTESKKSIKPKSKSDIESKSKTTKKSKRKIETKGNNNKYSKSIAKQWWKFSYRCIKGNLEEKRQRKLEKNKLDYFYSEQKERKLERNEYIKCYQKKLALKKKKWAKSDEFITLQVLESKLPLNVIFFYRFIAKFQYQEKVRKEKELKNTTKGRKKK
ncbi:vacuolar protein sorting-associated protein 13a-related [Anaeramoeba flamelloides]|uniref:Vacuolar protein sorting-associated protein 13a-related n=1 Tax=Anaeramoeba flamelloides TaxID=1746091 RepID=A0AAV8ABJ2_9EUKA|nr:vacuolar protein sorting-associated protein 13a-related [Anaeramoeba flamelloides]